MKKHLLIICAVLGCLGGKAAPVDTNPPPRLTFELRDGSRVVGTGVAKVFKFHSALLGRLKLNVQDVRSIDCASSNSTKLATINGDLLTVSMADSEFAVNTSFGRVELPVASVRNIVVSAGGIGTHPSGLVALWSGEGDGTDAVGGNNAILTDITFADGKVGRAFSFNGYSSCIRIPANRALDIGPGAGFTIMAWLKPADVDGFHPLFQWAGNDALNCSICFNATETGVLMGCLTDGVGNRFLVSNQNVLTSGVFQHIAVTYDKASGIGSWYLNGVIVARRQLSGQVAPTTGDLWLSRRNTHQGDWSSNRSYAGLMDEIALYNRALSADEIQSVCTEGSRGEPLATPVPSTGWFENWMR